VRWDASWCEDVEASEYVALWEGVRSMDIDVFDSEARVSFVCTGLRLGESGYRTELKLKRARDLRGEALRRIELLESKLP
jgi:hypothetical protein